MGLDRSVVFEHLESSVLLADAQGRIVDANPAAEAEFGPRSELTGRALHEILPALVGGPQAVDLAALLVDLESVREPGGELLTRDARRIQWSARCLPRSGSQPGGWLVELRDRTEERRYEHFVLQSQKLETVGSLAAGMAHEVNNPLAFLRSNLAYLRQAGDLTERELAALPAKRALELAEQVQVVDECLDGIDRISRIVDALRRFSRLPDEDFADLNVNDALREAIALAQLHENRSVAMAIELQPDLPGVHGSSQRLTQVFLNLLVNAKQALASSAEPALRVRTTCTESQVEITVQDNGPGVPEEIRSRIFDPFYTTKAPDEGTGLGLAIAFDIVAEHGGLLELRSGTEPGACFQCLLPRAGFDRRQGPRDRRGLRSTG